MYNEIMLQNTEIDMNIVNATCTWLQCYRAAKE